MTLRDIWQCLETTTTRGWYWYLLSSVRDVGIHQIMHTTAPYIKEMWAQNVNSATSEESALKEIAPSIPDILRESTCPLDYKSHRQIAISPVHGTIPFT